MTDKRKSTAFLTAALMLGSITPAQALGHHKKPKDLQSQSASASCDPHEDKQKDAKHTDTKSPQDKKNKSPKNAEDERTLKAMQAMQASREASGSDGQNQAGAQDGTSSAAPKPCSVVVQQGEGTASVDAKDTQTSSEKVTPPAAATKNDDKPSTLPQQTKHTDRLQSKQTNPDQKPQR